MSKKKSFKESNFYKELVQLRTEMKPMSFRNKVDHIWTYYKEYIGLVALALFVTIGLITSMVTANKNSVITGIVVNITMDQEAHNYLSVDYADHLGIQNDEKVKLESTSFYDLETNPSEENYYASMIVINEVSAKMLDYMILDELGMKFYVSQEVYMDLRDFFTAEELKAFAEKDLLIYCLEEESADLTKEELIALQAKCLEEGSEIDYCWPAAVKINDIEYIKQNVTNEGDIYFALAGSTEKTEAVRALWEYMKAWKTE